MTDEAGEDRRKRMMAPADEPLDDSKPTREIWR
jgi:hypothetical protein